MEGQARVVLWCVPRSCSNAFTKSVSQLENLKIIPEPFAEPYYLGTERVSSRFGQLPPMASREFTVVREFLEGDFKGFYYKFVKGHVPRTHRLLMTLVLTYWGKTNHDYSAVFVKDLAYYIGRQLGRWRDILPTGYQHTFLIRNPTKTVTSFYKAVAGGETRWKGDLRWEYFDTDEVEFQSIHDLFFLLKKETGKTPVLVDADDLLCDPDGILKLFCSKTGMKFCQSMLSWKKGGVEILNEKSPGWQRTLVPSTGFLPPPSSLTSGLVEIPEEVRQCIDDNMEYYKKLYAYRISC